MAIVVNY